MNIQTVAENLRNTIAGKEKMLAEQREGIAILTNDRKLIAYEGEVAVLQAIRQFLEINIDELKRILLDVEQCIKEKA